MDVARDVEFDTAIQDRLLELLCGRVRRGHKHELLLTSTLDGKGNFAWSVLGQSVILQ